MLSARQIDKIVFLDIETTSQYPTLKDAPEKYQKLFLRRFKADVERIEDKVEADPSLETSTLLEELYNIKAPLQAEFGRILCISCGMLTKQQPETTEDENNNYVAKIVTYTNEDEEQLLLKFNKQMSKILTAPQIYGLCGHHAVVFDFPFIAKRMMLNGIAIPKALSFEDKPWNLTHLMCTKQAYAMGVYDSAISLDMLAYSLGVKSSKEAEDMDGSDVKDTYWIKKDLAKICRYCEADVLALMEIFLKMKGIKGSVTVQ